MTRWQGLMKKEWIMNWKGLVLLVAISSAISLFSVSYAFNGVPADMRETVSSLIETIAKIHIWYAVVFFIVGLRQEMDHSDSWLHSTASTIELISVKAVAIIYMLVISLTACTLIVGSIYYNGGGTIPLSSGIALGVSVIMAILQNSIMVMAGGLLIWVVFRVLRTRIGKLSYIVTGIVMILSISTWFALLTTDVMHSINEMGPLFTSLTANYSDLPYRNFIVMGIAPKSSFITIGNSGLYAVATVVLFITSTALFEKKVRL